MPIKNTETTIIDCTLRDGGYYNNWNFSFDLANNYLAAMKSAKVNIVEIGFRFLNTEGFKGPFAFSTDNFIKSLDIPKDLIIGVMINASDLYTDIGWQKAIEKLFPKKAKNSPVKIVRIACHIDELQNAVHATDWLKNNGYRVGINLMQIAERTKEEIIKFTKIVKKSKPEVIYFADSMGGMKPKNVSRIIDLLKKNWSGNIGIHTHDNMGLALTNTLEAKKRGATWLDSTVTGMGRGPGNTKTEELIIELHKTSLRDINVVPLLSIIRNFFLPLKKEKNWGTNVYYYLAGKYGIHPTYIQIMMSDNRYSDEDILSTIDYLKINGGHKFQKSNLNYRSQFYNTNLKGKWSPKNLFKNKNILILGSGNGVSEHKIAIENFVKKKKPVVLALNIQKEIKQSLIDFFIVSNPVRLLADANDHLKSKKPLITPFSMISKNFSKKFSKKKIFDFGLKIENHKFEFHENYCVVPNSLVISYALATCISGKVSKIFMAGFDGYPDGDIRNGEIEEMLNSLYKSIPENFKESIISITPTNFKFFKIKSVYTF